VLTSSNRTQTILPALNTLQPHRAWLTFQ